MITKGFAALLRFAVAASLLAGFAVSGPDPALAGSAVGGLVIKVLSNRADLISGGDALVEILLPPKARRSKVGVDVDGRDVTGAFAVRANGRVVKGLAIGDNLLTARASGVRGAQIRITNHPIGGPVFSGEQILPWLCTTQGNGLGPSDDAQCNATTVHEFFYRPRVGSG